MQNTRAIGRHNAAIDAPRAFGEPLEILGSACDLIQGFGEWLAFFQGHLCRDVRCPLQNQSGCTLEDLGALVRHRAAPYLKACLRDLQRMIKVIRGGERYASQFSFGRGVHHRGGVASFSTDPFSTDEKIERVVGRIHSVGLHRVDKNPVEVRGVNPRVSGHSARRVRLACATQSMEDALSDLAGGEGITVVSRGNICGRRTIAPAATGSHDGRAFPLRER